MDSNNVTAVAGILTAIAAIAGALIIVWQTRLTMHTQVFHQLLSRWESADMQKIRSYAASSLLADKPISYVDDVLDFFETLALFRRRKILDEDIVWHTFYWAMVCYWCKTESYIRDAQKDEGAETWKDLSELMPVLIRREGTRPTAEQVKQFLTDETSRSVITMRQK
jgi:hypothetical protein